ncbi:hypothetical protein K3495_g538 [Podosphaera aphanis]|nr:hypothetical protein K3495_g538 [Podosphaera aphanis]
MKDYDDEKIAGLLLHNYFVHDFQNFNEIIFRKAPDLKPLRDYLRCHDVFVEKRRGIKMAPALAKTSNSSYMPLPSEEQIEVSPIYHHTQPTYQRSEEDKKAYALINLSKIYNHEQKYEGSPDEFSDDKYATFIENCNTVGLSKIRHHEAFHVMLKGAALQHCRTIIQQNKSIIPPLDKLVIAMKEFVEGKEHESMIRDQWDGLSLFLVLSEQTGDEKDVD